MKARDMSAAEAVEELERLGCEEDPIVWHREEMTVGDLLFRIAEDLDARDVQISYTGRAGCRVRGSLASMVVDRRRP